MSGTPQLQPGSVLGDYQIEGPLGSGASGLVFAGRGISNGKPVALKVLRSVVTGDELADEQQRFTREIRTCMGLSHPNIVPVIDTGTTPDGILFAAYERVPGDTLKSILANDGPLPFRDTVWLMGQVLRALTYSHSNGVIHRDIKPSNIMVSQNEDMLEARVLDFGVARLFRPGASYSAALTQEGLFLGTSQYACLDHVVGRTPRPAWDLFSWSIVLLETLSGEHPCQAGGSMPWADDAVIETPRWLRNHALGQMLTDFLLPRKTPDIDGHQLLRALESAGRDLNPRIVSPSVSRNRLVCVGTCQFSEAEEVPLSVDLQRHDSAVRACQEAGATIVEQFGGRILSRVGDRLTFGFGYDIGYEDQAVRAVQASLQIVDWTANQLPDQLPLRAHIGLHAGQAILEGKTSDGFVDVAGATPEGAALLGQLAAPGDIIASDAIRELLRTTLDLERLGETQLPGIRRPVATYRVDTRSQPEPSLIVPRTEFVGREADLAFFNDLADKAVKGQPSVASIAGDAGIGKSRLLQELRLQLQCLWLECRCQPDDRNSPYAPIVHLFDGLDIGVNELLANIGLASEVNLGLIGAMLTGDVRPLRSLGISLERQRDLLKDLLVRLLAVLAEREFVVVVIEDLHWADPSTIDVINQLVTDVSGWSPVENHLNILIITTARPVFVSPWSYGVHAVNLERLSDADIEEMIVKLKPDLEPHAVESILRRAEGNPLFAEEITLAGAYREQDDTSTQPGNLPPVLVQYLAPKVDSLSARAASVLRLASVLGREFDEQLLQNVTDDSDARFAQVLQELTDKGILHRRRTARSSRCVFKHSLIRDVVYSGIPERQTTSLHDRVASCLLTDFAEEVARRPEVLASHLYAAGRYEDAIDQWALAIPRLLAVGAYDEAESLGRRASRAVERVTNEDERMSRKLTVIELLGTAVSSKVGLAAPEVQEIYAPAVDLFNQLGSRAPLGVMWGIWSYNVVSQALEEPTEVLIRQFLDAARQTDDYVVVATAHSAAGTREFLLSDVHGSLEHFNIADQVRDSSEFQKSVRYHDVGMFIPAWRMSALALSGEFDEAVAVREALLQEARSLGSPAGLSLALSFALNSYRIALDFPGLIELADEQLKLCTEQNMIGLMGPAQCSRGWARVWQGDSEGLDEIQQGIDFCDAVGMRLNQVMHKAGQAEALLLTGESVKALSVIIDALKQSASTIERYQDGELLRLQGEAHMKLRQPAAAADSFRLAIQRAREQGVLVSELKARVSFASALASQSEVAEACAIIIDIEFPTYQSHVPVFDQLQAEVQRIEKLNSVK